MRTLAICCAEFAEHVKAAAGVDPLLSPPLFSEDMTPTLLEGYDFLYFKMHGLPDQPYWHNNQGVPILTAEQVRRANLTGTVVFVANCYLPESPMLQALLGAGARYVVGGSGENKSRKRSMAGADSLGQMFRFSVQLGASPPRALAMAKVRVRLQRRDIARADALEFKIWSGKNDMQSV